MTFPRLILVFLAVDWPVFSRRPMLVALAEKAAEYGTTVVAVNRPLCPISTFVRKPHRVRELFRKPKLDEIAPNLYLYSPKYFLHDSVAQRWSAVEHLNLRTLRRSIKAMQRRIGIDVSSPVVWYYHPQQAYVSQLFCGSFNIFELYDSLSDVYGIESKTVLELEVLWRPTVDLLLATSPALLEHHGPDYKRSRFLKNGLSRSAYEALSTNSTGSNVDTESIPHPRLGYAGEISSRLNWDLIKGLCDARPGWSFVFAGRVTHQRFRDLMSTRPNIYYLGEQAQEKVPEIVRRFDIGFLPYLDNAFFHYLNPLKIYEHCAAGLPSVASPIAILDGFPEGVVTVCNGDSTEWITAVESVLSRKSPETAERCKDFARQHIWEDIVTDLWDFLRSLIMSRTVGV